MIEGAIFDVDGTLLDTMPMWHDCGARYLSKQGIEAEPGLGNKLFTMTPETSAEYIINTYGLHDKSEEEVASGLMGEMEDCYFNFAKPKPGAVELLETMKEAGLPMAVVTSTDGYCIEAAFKRLDLRKYFTDIFSCDKYHTTKGERLIFDKAAESMDADVSATWVFDDGLFAVKTAKKAGYRAVGVYDEISDADWEELQKNADISVRTLVNFADDYGEKIKNYEE